METLKIVQIAHAFPPFAGGTSHVAQNLTKNLVKMGHEVEVVTLDVSGGLSKGDCFEGVKINRFRGLAPRNCYYVPSPNVVSYFKTVKADVVHGNSLNALLLPTCWIALRNRLTDFAFVLSPHNHPEGSTWHTRMFWKPYTPIAAVMVNSARQVHCVSNYEANVIKEQYGAESVVIENGVEADTFLYHWKPPSNEVVLTYAGRIEAYKRIHTIIIAASLLNKNTPKLTVRIIGDGPELPKLQDLASRLNVRLEHYSFLERKAYLELLSTSSYFINPSKYEAFSIVVAEAKTIGVPVVVASPWCGIFNGLPNVSIVNGDSPEEIARAVSKTTIKDKLAPCFMTWQQVAKRVVEEVYLPALNAS
jgi:glycosyltransferase involved in cell wall biosynthesis